MSIGREVEDKRGNGYKEKGLRLWKISTGGEPDVRVSEALTDEEGSLERSKSGRSEVFVNNEENNN